VAGSATGSRVQANSPAQRGQDAEDFVPANDVERDLREAADAGNSPGGVGAAAGAAAAGEGSMGGVPHVATLGEQPGQPKCDLPVPTRDDNPHAAESICS